MKKRIDDPQSPCSKPGNICAQLEVEWIDETLLGIGSFGSCVDGSLTIAVLYE
jgi:hypothetical protein